MRTSRDEFSSEGELVNGFDYENQAWMEDGKYLACGHPESMICGCFGRIHEGKTLAEVTVSNLKQGGK